MCNSRYLTRQVADTGWHLVGHSAAASELSGTAGSQALHDGDDVFGVGPTGAEEASQLVASAFGDGLAVDEDLELSKVTWLDGHVDIKALFDDGGETRRAFLVASSGAVTDLDVHDASKGVGVSDATAFSRRAGIRDLHPLDHRQPVHATQDLAKCDRNCPVMSHLFSIVVRSDTDYHSSCTSPSLGTWITRPSPSGRSGSCSECNTAVVQLPMLL